MSDSNRITLSDSIRDKTGADYPMQEMSAKKIERFLEDFANLKPGDKGDTERFLNIYRSFFPSSFPSDFEKLERKRDQLLADEMAIIQPDVVNPEGRTEDEIRDGLHMAIWGLAHQLRNIWDEPGLEDKDWHAHELRRWFYLRTEPERSRRIPAPPPSSTVFQKVLNHFKDNADRARRCQRPGCVKPYYFSPERRATKYCSAPCAEWAKQDAKLRYDRKQRSRENRRNREKGGK